MKTDRNQACTFWLLIPALDGPLLFTITL